MCAKNSEPKYCNASGAAPLPVRTNRPKPQSRRRNSNGSNLRVEHNLEGRTVTEEELRQVQYDTNQQRGGRKARHPGDPIPFLRNQAGEWIPEPTDNSAEHAVPSADKLEAARQKDLKTRNIKPS